MLKIDAKDRKLLYQLDLDSRQTLQQLAKKIGLSKDAVKYRINSLIKGGIIKSFNAVVDSGKLGFIGFRMFLKFYALTPEKEQALIKDLLQNENLVWMVHVEGAWDLNTWFLYRTIEEMNSFWEGFLESYAAVIEKREFGIYSEVTYFGRPFLLDKQHTDFSVKVVSLGPEEKLDALDLDIIRSLSKDARIPIVEMARSAKSAPKTILSHLRRLEEKRIIVGYRTEFDLDKLGVEYYKLHLSIFNASPQQVKRLKSYVSTHPNVVYVDSVLGGYDIEVEVQIGSVDKMREFVGELRHEFAPIIRNYEILRYYHEYRLRFFPTK